VQQKSYCFFVEQKTPKIYYQLYAFAHLLMQMAIEDLLGVNPGFGMNESFLEHTPISALDGLSVN